MKWAVSPFSANPHSGRRCHLKSMLVSSVHIPKAARRRKFRSNGRDSHCTVGAPRKSKLRRKQKLDNQLTQWTATNPFLKRLIGSPKKRTVQGSQPQIAEIPSYHLPETTRPPGPGRGTLWGFSAKPDPPLQYTGLLLWVSEPPTTRKDLWKFFIGISWWFTFTGAGWIPMKTIINDHKLWKRIREFHRFSTFIANFNASKRMAAYIRKSPADFWGRSDFWAGWQDKRWGDVVTTKVTKG